MGDGGNKKRKRLENDFNLSFLSSFSLLLSQLFHNLFHHLPLVTPPI